MTEKVRAMYDLVRSCEYRKERINNDGYDLSEVYLSDTVNYGAYFFEDMLQRETPYILEGDIFGFNRRNVHCPHYYKDGKRRNYEPGNITPNYARVIESGLDGVLEQIEKYEKINVDGDSHVFYGVMRRYILAVLDISERYRKHAEEIGNKRLADALSRLPRKGARSFYEACLFFKIIVYTIRCANNTHVTVGRFDQYMYPYFRRDIQRGVSKEELFDTLELLFISLNVDSDIYFGVQQGDNGQSMVLGGYDKDGNDCFNELSKMCLVASREIKMIDPKINLRVGKRTPSEIYELGTTLTKQGLGFPQYCNDDVIVPYMLSMGYDEDDAYNYTVAACWEVISPNNGTDVPNAANFSLPKAVNEALYAHLRESEGFDEFMERVGEVIKKNADELIEREAQRVKKKANMYLSIYVDGCIEKGRDMTCGGGKYNNYGTHGTGISNATDALAAIKKTVFDEKSVSADGLIAALEANFAGYEDLRKRLLACPKMGNNDSYSDEIAGRLIDLYAKAFNGRSNGHGGVWRAGSGSAQNYALDAKKVGATADGRLADDYFACSFSPSITTKLNGPLSVIQSFTKFDLKKICNGGPLTLELHDSVFRNGEGEKKVAMLAKLFVDRGGHQLQLNAVNREHLLDAKENPAAHRNLIVRVWGWSGYFCELEELYQDHIIRRTEFTV